MGSVTGWTVATMIAAYLTASAMTLLALPASVLALVFLILLAAVAYALGGIAPQWRQPPPDRLETAVLVFAALIGLLRLAPYAWQYVADVLVAPVTWDDNWHFQELASLVNAGHYPPRLNFHPEAYFHFYYLPWIPAAALAVAFDELTGAAMIKLAYALGALLLDLAVAWVLIVAIRHLVSPPGRAWTWGALLIAGAAIDGLFAIRHLVVLGYPQHAEWWQAGLLILNSFSALSSALIWVPHHMMGAAAVLLALVVASEPTTLRPRDGLVPYLVAGLLMGVAAYSSVFAFAGGLIALTPLVWELARMQDKRRLATLLGATLGPALPLAYIYLGAEARGGVVIGQPFVEWVRQTGSIALGVIGIVIAFVAMMLEAGWLYAVGRVLDRGEADGARMRRVALAAAVVLVSTCVIGFTGSNNWALRATIVPVVLLAAYVGRGFAVERTAPGPGPAGSNRELFIKAGAVFLGLAAFAHINEVALLIGAAVRAPAFAVETAACKTAILAINKSPPATRLAAEPSGCRDSLSAYHIERPFEKAALSPADKELMGRGPGFWDNGGKRRAN